MTRDRVTCRSLLICAIFIVSAEVESSTAPSTSMTTVPQDTTPWSSTNDYSPVNGTDPDPDTTPSPSSNTTSPVNGTDLTPNTTSSPLSNTTSHVNDTDPDTTTTPSPSSNTTSSVNGTDPDTNTTPSPLSNTTSPVNGTDPDPDTTPSPPSNTTSPVNGTDPDTTPSPPSNTTSPVNGTDPDPSTTSSPLSNTTSPVNGTDPDPDTTPSPPSNTTSPVNGTDPDPDTTPSPPSNTTSPVNGTDPDTTPSPPSNTTSPANGTDPDPDTTSSPPSNTTSPVNGTDTDPDTTPSPPFDTASTISISATPTPAFECQTEFVFNATTFDYAVSFTWLEGYNENYTHSQSQEFKDLEANITSSMWNSLGCHDDFKNIIEMFSNFVFRSSDVDTTRVARSMRTARSPPDTPIDVTFTLSLLEERTSQQITAAVLSGADARIATATIDVIPVPTGGFQLWMIAVIFGVLVVMAASIGLIVLRAKASQRDKAHRFSDTETASSYFGGASTRLWLDGGGSLKELDPLNKTAYDQIPPKERLVNISRAVDDNIPIDWSVIKNFGHRAGRRVDHLRGTITPT